MKRTIWDVSVKSPAFWAGLVGVQIALACFHHGPLYDLAAVAMKPNTPITMYDEAGWEVQVQPTIPTKPNNIPMAGRTVQATNPIATGPVTVTLPVPDPQDLIETFLTPYDQGAGETRYLTMVNGAKNKIRMCAFGFTDPQVSAALVAAQARHVDIGIVRSEERAGGPHQMIEIAKLKATNIPLW